MKKTTTKVNPQKGYNGGAAELSSAESVQARHNKILHICLSLSGQTGPFNAATTYNDIKEYSEKHHRWFYSDISNYLFGNVDIGVFLSNLDALQEYAYQTWESARLGTEKTVAESLVSMIDKLWDHSNLAQKQISALRDDDEAFKQRFERNIGPYTEDMNKQLISLIGIFTALSFIVFGGISSLDNIFAEVGGIPIIELILVGCIWSFCILNLVFSFVYLVSKLTKLPIRATDKIDATLVQKYPFWVWSNFFLLLVFAVFCWLYYIDYSNSGSWLIILSQKNSVKATFVGCACIIIPFGYIAYRLINNKNGKK